MSIIPNRLKKGDTIGVVSLSDPITSEEIEEVQKSVKKMKGLRAKCEVWKICI